jgi:hypothetical protein
MQQVKFPPLMLEPLEALLLEAVLLEAPAPH